MGVTYYIFKNKKLIQTTTVNRYIDPEKITKETGVYVVISINKYTTNWITQCLLLGVTKPKSVINGASIP